MKKNVFWLAAMAAAVSMTGCSLDEVVDKAEVRSIGFDAFANKSSRATVNAKTFGHTSFGVWGRYEEATSNYVNVFENKEVSWSKLSDLEAADGAWEYSPLVPWVAGKNYTFAAVAPYNAAFSYDYTNGYTLGEITLDATYSEGKYTNQVDYLTATVRSGVQSTISGGKVGFTFNHIVSNIIFNFQPKKTNTADETTAWTSPVQIIIKNITLSNVLTNKKYTNNTWSAADSPSKDNFSKDLSGDNVTTYEPAGSTGEPAQVLTPLENKFSWFVVPQDNTADASDRKLTLTFDIKTKDTDGNYNVVVKENATASVDIDTEWATNIQYTYTVYIGTDVLGQDAFITFDVASVAGWGSSQSDDLEVTVPQNP